MRWRLAWIVGVFGVLAACGVEPLVKPNCSGRLRAVNPPVAVATPTSGERR